MVAAPSTAVHEPAEAVGLRAGDVQCVLGSAFVAGDGTPRPEVVTFRDDAPGGARPRAEAEGAAVHRPSAGEIAERDHLPTYWTFTGVPERDTT